jgi:hypothetical protein
MSLNDKYLEGAKYFMCVLSQETSLPYITSDIRKIIWDYVVLPHYMLCHVNEHILRLNLNII